jgi:hypothetical protein
MAQCPHREWANPRNQGLACVDCGTFWPGHQLPLPAHDREGYGEVANNKSWGSRVNQMITELQEIA